MRLGGVRHLHFMGIGGAGMSALAELALSEGLTVSGCDLQATGRTRALEKLGARVTVGHDPRHVDDADVLVVTSAVAAGHPEVNEAHRLGVAVVRRATLLAEAMRGHLGVAVAGTHGKTTTSAMTGFVLTQAGCDPTVAIGGHAPDLGGHSRHGHGELMVCEADEYDRSFLELAPAWVVITNIEAEHLDTYGTVEALEGAFAELAARVPFYGALIACLDDPGAARVAAAHRGRVVTYGTSAAARLRAEDLRVTTGGSRFTVHREGSLLGEIELGLPGAHNVRNALAAIAVGLEVGLAIDDMVPALAEFGGVERRFQLLGDRAGITVVDDYAHHPTEIRALVAAARGKFPGRRLVVAFQPHLYSRTQRFASELGAALAAADSTVVLPIYPARERPLPGVDAELVVEAVKDCGGVARSASSLEDALRELESELERGDVLLTVGAGDVDRVGVAWLGGEA